MDEPQRTIWQAGWRPAIGWACTAGITTVFVFQPIWLLLATDIQPQIETSALVALTTAILGIGSLRTYEKIKGVSK